MPPRRSRRIQAHEPSPATISDLPDDLLAKCFAPLDLEELLGGAALVSRRWCEVSSRPELLRKVEFYERGNAAATLAAARSLLRWMQRHGPAVRSLYVDFQCIAKVGEDDMAELLSLVDSWLMLCSSKLRKLVMLSMWLDCAPADFTLGAWVNAAPCLTELSITGLDRLQTPFTLVGMTALQRLHVNAGWQMGSSVKLPTSITRLDISDGGDEMPSQVAALTNLRSLAISYVSHSEESMKSLTRLSSLRHTAFSYGEVPASFIFQLSGLQVLQIQHPDDEAGDLADRLDSALRQLTQLTGLWLDDMPLETGTPPSLAGLSRLQWLYWRPWYSKEVCSAEEAVLPLGPWQRSLRHISTSLSLAQLNLQFLSGTKQLHMLSLVCPFEKEPGPEEQFQAFCRWAAQHEALQRIDFEESQGAEWKAKTIGQMQTHRPTMRIDDHDWNVLGWDLLTYDFTD